MIDELLAQLGLSQVTCEHIKLYQSSGQLELDVNVKELELLSSIQRLREMIAHKTGMNVRLHIHFLCIDQLLTGDHGDFLLDFVTSQCPGIGGSKVTTSFTDGKYVLELPGDLYQQMVKSEQDVKLKQLLDELFGEKVPVSFVGGAQEKAADQPQENGGKFVRRPVTEKGMLYGRAGRGTKVDMAKIEFGAVTVTGEIFSVECRDIERISKSSLTFTVTDYTSSVNCNLFGKTKEVKNVELKKGMWVTVYGTYMPDEFSGGLILKVKGIKAAENPYERMDTHEGQRRVELHMHTQMSAMDSVLDVEKLVALADKWGHKAVAVTDHGVVQSFPAAYDAAKKRNINIIYGCEGYLFDDKNQYVFAADNRKMSEPIVVFDLETTGFFAGSDGITEIGAAKVVEGEIVDTFHTMVNPGRTIPLKVTQVTGITNEMVKDAPGVDQALDAFYDYAKGCALCAHNASFDLSFLLCFDRQNRFDVPVIDTLALARRMLPNVRNHKLGTLVKYLGIPLASHHRADHDAKATAELMLKLFALYEQEGVTTLRQINDWSMRGGQIQGGDTRHVILLAKDKTGLHNLYELVSKAHLDYFYKKPRIPKSLLAKKRDGLLIGSACEQGELYQAILKRKPDQELENIASFYDYLEIQPDGNNRFLVREGRVKNSEELHDINRKIVALGKKLNKPIVATCDTHFIEERDQIYRKILLAGQGFSDAAEDSPLYFRTTDEMLKEFAYLGEELAEEVVITGPNRIADMCQVEKPFPDDKTYTPSLPGAEDEITRLTKERALTLYGENLHEAVKARMEKELKSITGYGFAVLYLIAQKLVKKSLDDGYLVGSRGSVGSSFVAYLSGITEVNPLPPHYRCPSCKQVFFDQGTVACGKDLPDKTCEHCGHELIKDGYDIPFEVFLGFHGDKVPDIDLNFSGEYQPVAHKYIEELFGEGHVYRAGTVNTLQDKTAYGFVKKYAEENSLSVSNAEINRLVGGCTGVKRTTGQHPGGIVIVPRDFDVYDFTPIQNPADSKDGGVITTHFDFNSMHDILVKVDALGHDDPTMLRLLQDMTGIDPKTIPLDDQDTMSLFSSTKALGITEQDIHCKVGTFGIPEFGTRFVRQMLYDTLPTTMEELVRISGLSHGTGVWLSNAQDLIKAGTVTLSQAICTRDDIMNYLISKGVAEKTAFEVMEFVRKGKSNKISEEQLQEMRAAGVPEWYIDSCYKIGYMFPRAHAAAYVMMAFRIAWYKVHHPVEYYAAYFYRNIDDFDVEKMSGSAEDIDSRLKALEGKKDLSVKDKTAVTLLEMALEMRARGFCFLPVDLERSDASKFLVEDGKLRMPFRAIGGLGESVARAIVQERQHSPFLSVEDLKKRTGVNKTVVDIMKNMGCLAQMSATNQLSLF